MPIEFRSINPDEFIAFDRATNLAFGSHAREEEAKALIPVFECDRSVAAFDGTAIVGTGAIHSYEMTLPGLTAVPAAGITWIGVVPTHRRRGILTGVMRRLFADMRERGDPLGILYASETVIYGRFGFGISTFQNEYEIDPRYSAFARAPETPGTVRLIGIDEARALLPDIYDRARRQIPGALSHTRGDWEVFFTDPEVFEPGAAKYFYAVYESPDGSIDGYIAYRVKHGAGDWLPSAEVRFEGVNFMTVTDEARTALWRYCLDIDLIAKVTAVHMPVDEPVPWMLADPRRFRVTNHVDSLWTRLLDIPAALTARRYATSDRLTFAIEDRFCPENTGVYCLEGSPDGAECTRISAEPDLSLQIDDLGACYLGGVRFTTLARASRIVEHTPGTLRRADLMFAAERQPYCTADF